MDTFSYIFICYNGDPVHVLTPFQSKRLIYLLFRDYFQKPNTARTYYKTLQNPVTFICKCLKQMWTA